MYSAQDYAGVYSFLKSTPEGHLRKMLVGGPFSDLHFKLVLKLARGSSEEIFVQSALEDKFGTLRLNGPELGIKENFWKICGEKFTSLGLLGMVKAA